MRVNHDKGKDDVKEVRAAEMREKFAGSILRTPGLTLYEFNPQTGAVIVAVMEKTVTLTAEGPRNGNKLVVNDGCVYSQHSNLKTALKKFSKYSIIFPAHGK